MPSGKRWTPEEHEQFLALLTSNTPAKEIAATLDKSLSAVYEQAEKRGIKVSRPAPKLPHYFTVYCSNELLDRLLTLSFHAGGGVSTYVRNFLDENLPAPPEQPTAPAPGPRNIGQGKVLQGPKRYTRRRYGKGSQDAGPSLLPHLHECHAGLDQEGG